MLVIFARGKEDHLGAGVGLQNCLCGLETSGNGGFQQQDIQFIFASKMLCVFRSCSLRDELTAGGTRPVTLPNGETRSFLADGDEVAFKGRCQRDGFASIGFGSCAGTIMEALPFS